MLYVDTNIIFIIFLSFTAAVDQLKPQKPAVRPQPESRGRIDLYVWLTAAVSVLTQTRFLLSPVVDWRKLTA